MLLLRDQRRSERCSRLAFLGAAASTNAKFKQPELFNVAQRATLNCGYQAKLRSRFRNSGANARDPGNGGHEAVASSTGAADEPADDGWNRAGNQKPYQVALSHSSRSRQARFLSKPAGSVISFSEMNG